MEKLPQQWTLARAAKWLAIVVIASPFLWLAEDFAQHMLWNSFFRPHPPAVALSTPENFRFGNYAEEDFNQLDETLHKLVKSGMTQADVENILIKNGGGERASISISKQDLLVMEYTGPQPSYCMTEKGKVPWRVSVHYDAAGKAIACDLFLKAASALPCDFN